ncbi:hypothetical protein P43SY_003459 [Pythium insidiosum]|uniref:histone acetyltransferase n=1 Tax=Pythium insidiosum TaxID=114742 RepID=A0AAD5LFA3_PYTIN|nr:hypothetical protein P43SY_003459 [Pythium insidiosum]
MGNLGNADSIGFKHDEDEPKSETQLGVTIREVLSVDKQELDGVDVLIFTLYVQEYGPNSLSPNAGRVYISYLDSPENQKIPKAARLRAWYQKLLLEAKKEGLVVNISNLYAEYYVKKKAAHELPYFEGDYWPRLAEDLIKQLEEKGPGRGDKSAGSVDATNASGDMTSGDGGVEDTVMTNVDGDGDGGDGLKTPSMSPAPSDELNGAAGGDDLTLPPARGSTSGKSAKMNGKSKKKRSKKGPDAASSTRSTTMTRSKKGAVHASGCGMPDCTFTNCQRMRSMLKHAHARQCQKQYQECKVPRCADIRRHFLAQLQQRQEQMERLRQQQQAAAAGVSNAAGAIAAASPTIKKEGTPASATSGGSSAP